MKNGGKFKGWNYVVVKRLILLNILYFPEKYIHDLFS